MHNLCKRIIALLLAFCLVCSLCFSSFAVSSENQATFWEAWLAYLAGQNDHWSFLDGIGTFDMLGSLVAHDTVCGQSSDGYHHGTQIESLVDGRAKVKCTECGEWFYYSASDLQNQYNNYVGDNNLDNGVSISPDGGVFWMPVFSDISSGFFSASSRSGGTALFYLSPSQQNSSSDFISDNYSSSSRSCSVYSPRSDETTFTAKLYSISFNPCFLFPFSGSWSVSDSSHLSIPLLDTTLSFSGSFIVPDSCSKQLSLSEFYDQTTYIRSIIAYISLPTFRFNGSFSAPSVPQNITINNITYPVIDIDFNTRTIHVDDNRTIIYDDDKIIIKQGDTVIEEHNYYIDGDEEPDPGGDPAGSSGSTAGGSGCCEQCALLLRQANTYLQQIQTLVDQINDKLGPDGDNYTQGIYNLLVEINNALDNLPTSPHTDYESKLTTICNQLANIWGDLETIKTSLSAVENNTAETNEKLDTVHSDLEAVLAELQEQKGILQQILDTLKKILGHVTTIDENVEELSTEENTNNFLLAIVNKFGFINQIYGITVQMFKDITNDAVTSQDVSNGVIPVGDVTPVHAPSYGGAATAPQVLCEFPEVSWNGMNFGGYTALDLSWYAPYKPKVDAILSGFFWLSYIYMLFKRLPAIIHGEAMTND